MSGLRTSLAALLLLVLSFPSLMAVGQGPRVANATSVFCAHGGVGLWPSGQLRLYYAVAVVIADPTRNPTRYEMTLTGLGPPISLRGKANGRWPT